MFIHIFRLFPVKRNSKVEFKQPEQRTRQNPSIKQPDSSYRLFLLPYPTKKEEKNTPTPILLVDDNEDINIIENEEKQSKKPKKPIATGFKRPLKPYNHKNIKKQKTENNNDVNLIAINTPTPKPTHKPKPTPTQSNEDTQAFDELSPTIELNLFAKFYSKVTNQKKLISPPQRLVQEYCNFTYLRKHPKEEWKSSDFIYTFLYLEKIFEIPIA